MKELKNAEWEGMTMRLQALRAAEKSLRQNKNDPAVLHTIRRIGHSFRIFDEIHQNSEIATLAQLLTDANDRQIRQVFGHVLPKLKMLTENLQHPKHWVLVVEDDPVTKLVLEQRLGSLYRVVAVKTLQDAEKALMDHPISFILLDLQLPDGDGREFLLKLRERPATTTIPLFVVSSQKGHAVQTECFALGADGFFQKPFDPLTLSTALASRLEKITELTRRSLVDPLTGLPNRAGFANAFKRAALLASRSGQPLTVAMLDVDRFKAVNDLYGHFVGDQVLKRLANVLSVSLRASDVLARWGGEEFVVFFPNTDLVEAKLAMNKALKAFRAERFFSHKRRRLHVTFSAGLVRVTPGITLERTVVEADRVLYLAKSSGRDHVVTERDKVSLKKRILLIEDDVLTAQILKKHLQRDGFKVIHVREGKTALASVRSGFSLITLDVKIPHGDGFALLQKFRQMPALSQVPIVMLTSVSKVEEIVQGFQWGADDYIVKPFSPRELLARIHRLLNKQ